MSVATVVENKAGKKPHYKDYVSFLENYRNGKKDDQNSVITNDSGVSFSLSNSSNNSSSSVYSDLTDAPRTSFKEYLENYNNKKYGSVQPPVLIKKQTDHQHTESKTVKTEVFLEINNPPATVTKTVDITSAQNVSNVSKVSKIFEKTVSNNDSTVVKAVPPSGKVNTFNFEHKDDSSRKTEGNRHKVTLKKSNSISEKSRVFEGSNNIPKLGIETKFQKEDKLAPKPNGCVSPKPPVNNKKPVFLSKASTDENGFQKTNGTVSPKHSVTVRPVIVPKAITEALVFQQKEDTTPVNTKPKIVTEKINLEISPVTNCAPPPPPPFPQENSQQPLQIKLVTPPPPPPIPALQAPQNGHSIVPPPPPLPTASLPIKRIQNSVPSTQRVTTNGVVVGTKTQDVVDGTAQPAIDKNDPRVKKLVYGALREMYGAYHDKANDYIATLPRNRVKKNNGLDSIINSIASQGGLDKLNGRVNPSVETD